MIRYQRKIVNYIRAEIASYVSNINHIQNPWRTHLALQGIFQSISTFSGLCLTDVIVGYISGLAGFRILHLAPGLAHGDDGQGITGHQATDGIGLLAGLHAQAHAHLGLAVAGFGDDGVGVTKISALWRLAFLSCLLSHRLTEVITQQKRGRAVKV